jgi:hypothetical protein
MTNQIKYIRKSQQMEITKNQLQVSITKTELNSLINDALASPETAAAIKKVLNPLLTDSFPQFPEFTNIALGDTAEDGSTLVLLKQPPTPKSTGPIKSIEPTVIDEPVDEPEVEDVPTEEEPAAASNAYVDPLA